MPFAVRQWPVAPDPRGALFSFVGWNWGQVVSHRWVLSSTDATGQYEFLNVGAIVPFFSDDGTTTIWDGDSGGVAPVAMELKKVGVVPAAGSPLRTIELFLRLKPPSPTPQTTGALTFLRPDAIRQFGPFVMDIFGVPNADIPNGITITPAIWNLETP